jgi:hypothetical protein
MDGIVETKVEEVRIDENLRNDCMDSLKEVIKQNAKINYKNALMKECDQKIRELAGNLRPLRDLVRDINTMDVNRDYVVKTEFDEFEEEMSEQSLGFDMFNASANVNLSDAFVDFVMAEKLREEKIKRDKEYFDKITERNYQRHKLELREQWAFVYSGVKRTALKIIDLKEKLKIIRIKEPKVVNYNWDIVMSTYFENEAIKRAVKDLEFKRKNFNSFKLDRCRKQRARSIID